jgi:alkylresorcinol/alkylpyrone synthase
MAQARPGANVLFLTVDLCTLCMRTDDQSLAMFVAAALFGDGAAGVVLRSYSGEKRRSPRGRARIGAIGEHFWAKTEHFMGWAIKNDGFAIVLSPELPSRAAVRTRSAAISSSRPCVAPSTSTISFFSRQAKSTK